MLPGIEASEPRCRDSRSVCNKCERERPDTAAHCNNVFRLVQALAREGVALSEDVKADLKTFVDAMPAGEIDFKSAGVKLKKDEPLGIVEKFYALDVV